MALQELLNRIYYPLVSLEAVIERLKPISANESVLRQLNGPFLLAVSNQYEAFQPKVVIVGQENNGWLEYDYLTFLRNHTTADALAVYEGFDIGDYGPGAFGRYFSMFRERLRKVVDETNRRSVLWTNLFKLNHDGQQSVDSPLLEMMLLIQHDVFAAEIKVLRPDVVIFLTGPRYDCVIQRFYPDLRKGQVDSLPTNEVAQLKSFGLPELTFRTYHPAYLNRIISAKQHCVESIIERVTKAFP